MKYLAYAAVAGAIATAAGPAAQAGATSHRPPTTASLMPAYVQAAKYWQSRPLALKRATRSHHR
jgi:hypothetical protein